MHLPGFDRSAHEWQRRSQRESQHTPSTQKPVSHSASFVQVCTPVGSFGVSSTIGAGVSAVARVSVAPSPGVVSAVVESATVTSSTVVSSTVASSTVASSGAVSAASVVASAASVPASLPASDPASSGAVPHAPGSTSHQPDTQSAPVVQVALQVIPSRHVRPPAQASVVAPSHLSLVPLHRPPLVRV